MNHGQPAAETLLNVSRLTKTFGVVVALDDVSFSVRPGEVLGLIGPNGAGKTTLFECMAGLLPMDRGTVSLGGRALRPSERSSQLFYVPDGIAPWPAQTLGWALDFTLGFFGGRPDLKEELVRQLGLDGLLTARLGTLSKGQRKRAALAIGLLTPQPILLIDEPFDGLDLKQSRELAGALLAHAAGGRTLFLSIHQIADATRVCDRFLLLSAGRLRGIGTLDELAEAAESHGLNPVTRDLEEVFLALT